MEEKYTIYITTDEKNFMTHKVVGILFLNFRKQINNIVIEERKILTERFEEVIETLKIDILGISKIYDEKDDGLEILTELSNTISVKSSFKKLLDCFQRSVKNQNIIIEVKYSDFENPGLGQKIEREKKYNLIENDYFTIKISQLRNMR